MCIFLNQHSLTNGFVSLVRKILSLYHYFLEFARQALRGNLVHLASCMVHFSFKLVRDI